MTSAADLFALQEIDLRRDARRALIADIEARLGETEEVLAAREAVASTEAEAARLRRQQQDVEERLEDLDTKVRPLERRLYDGSVRNPKELTDMQKDMESLKRRRSRLDDEGLALMEAIEAAATALTKAREELRRTEGRWRAEQEELRAERSQAETEVARLEEERGLRSEALERTALGLYESLRSARQGRAVARIERGGCQGCHIGLPTHLVQRVRAGGSLIQCPSCERILVGG